MKQTWKSYAFWIVLTELVGLLSGFLSQEGMQVYAASTLKPPLTPPAIVFPVVWTILYALMGISYARIAAAPPSPAQTRSSQLFLLQLAANFLWSPVFFTLGAYGAALFLLVILWGLVLAMIRSFYQVDPPAAWLQIPYLLWLTFAAYLSFGVWRLNG